jgi:decaprenyl-phosphate phosphoribosyltransferase
VSSPSQQTDSTTRLPAPPTGVLAWLKLLRPKQWFKSAFVLIGPLYGWRDTGRPFADVVLPGIIAAVAFALVSSACYIVNDIVDAPRDRLHPRKKRRPIAAGVISPRSASILAGLLILVAAGCVALVPLFGHYFTPGSTTGDVALAGVAIALGLYALNVTAYSIALKRFIIADVMCLALGFVLRVLGGCAAAGVHPSSWLLNCTFFLAMFLAFGKRLGERRTMGGSEGAAAVRGVQSAYTDELLRMSVVVTAVATLVTYAGYVQSRESAFTAGFNLLWLTTLPATFGMFRAIVLLERGTFDDPTELAAKDRAFQAAAMLFAAITAGLVLLMKQRLT